MEEALSMHPLTVKVVAVDVMYFFAFASLCSLGCMDLIGLIDLIGHIVQGKPWCDVLCMVIRHNPA